MKAEMRDGTNNNKVTKAQRRHSLENTFTRLDPKELEEKLLEGKLVV